MSSDQNDNSQNVLATQPPPRVDAGAVGAADCFGAPCFGAGRGSVLNCEFRLLARMVLA